MSLAGKIFRLESFQREYAVLLSESVALQFGERLIRESKASQVDFGFLIKCGSGLASSEIGAHQDAALRIAHYSLIVAGDENIGLKRAASVIFDKLENRQAIRLARQRELLNEDIVSNTPFFLKLESLKRNFENEIEIVDGRKIVLNRFQKKVFKQAQEVQQLSVSAPTSAGKSFVLYQLIQLFLGQPEYQHVVYIVPTRALINQVLDEVEDELEQSGISSIYVSSVPEYPADEPRKKLFVYTQERLTWLLKDNSGLKIDLLIVDEAHKIEDKERGIILQNAIEKVLFRNANCRVVYASPSVENPELFLENTADGQGATIQSDYVGVNQNLIWLPQRPRKTQIYDMALFYGGERREVGNIVLDQKPAKEADRVPLVITKLASDTGGNLIYMGWPSQAEKIAAKIYDLIPFSTPLDQEISELITLVKTLVHPDYLLAEVLKKRIGFHYGNIPMPIREEIERLFKLGKLKYLVCTSTLIEGVNLPATNLFLYKPKKGTDKKMESADFWNLAGRAGRMGKEFQGNVICIRPDKWDEAPPTVRTKTTIDRSIRAVTSNSERILSFVKNRSPRNEAAGNGDLEYSFSYLFQRFLQGQELDSTHVTAANEALITNLKTEFETIREWLTLPENIIERNVGISPVAQENLYRYFQSQTSFVIPMDPTIRNAAQLYYEPLIDLIIQHLSGKESHIPSVTHAIFITNWMQGMPLFSIIRNQYKYWQTRGWSLGKTIRNTLKEIENYIQFQFLKFSTCYLDILSYHLEQSGRVDILAQIPKNFNLMLEFGVYSNTQISLIKLGFSRYASISISENIPNPNLTESVAVQFIAGNYQDWDVSSRLRKEIEKVVRRRG